MLYNLYWLALGMLSYDMSDEYGAPALGIGPVVAQVATRRNLALDMPSIELGDKSHMAGRRQGRHVLPKYRPTLKFHD
jgi:hypothetical protein